MQEIINVTREWRNSCRLLLDVTKGRKAMLYDQPVSAQGRCAKLVRRASESGLTILWSRRGPPSARMACLGTRNVAYNDGNARFLIREGLVRS